MTDDLSGIAAKLEALTDIVRSGFAKMDTRFERQDVRHEELSRRVNDLREWRARLDGEREAQERMDLVNQRIDEEVKKIDWQKITVGLIAVAALALEVLGRVVDKL